METNEYRLSAILYADIPGFSEAADQVVKKIVEARNGEIVKTSGDALFIDFKNPLDAFAGATELLTRLRGTPFRAGAHLGDVHLGEGDAHGEGVDVAAGLGRAARPGSVRVSSDFYDYVRGRTEIRAEKLGATRVERVEREILSYEIADADSRAADLRRRILLDIKTAGRRLSADQMRVRYGGEGPEAETVIRDMVLKGLLLREASPEERPRPGFPKDEIVHAVSELEYRIEDEIRKGLQSAFAEKRERRAERRERRGEEKRERELERSSFRTKADALDGYEEYSRTVRAEARSAKAGFAAHAATFAVVCGGLMALNAAVSPEFPWAVFPFGGWGIGVLEHFAALLRRGERVRELAKLPALDVERLDAFKRLQKGKDRIWHHFSSTVSTSAFLAGVNLLVSPEFLWFLFPAVGMGIGLVSHAASWAVKRRDLERDLLDSIGLDRMPTAPEQAPADLGPYRPLVDQARAIRAAVIELVSAQKGKKSSAGVDTDLLPTVDAYVEQVALLAERTLEADRIIDLIPMEALRDDRRKLAAKRDGASGESLRREYDKSLAELDKQEASYRELVDQREVLELRLRSSVNTLQQLRIDLARLSGMEEGSGSAAANALRGKTAELNRYLGDLRAGYEELDALESGIRLPPAPKKPE